MIPLRPASMRAASLPRSAIREIMALAAGRPDVIHLEVGEPDAPTPPHIVEAAARALREGWTRYASNAGLSSLRELVASRWQAHWDRRVSAECIVITTGAVGGLYTALTSVLDPGDELLIPDPGWPNYAAIPHLVGATAVRYPLSPQIGFMPDLDAIRSLTSKRTKAILINSPGNPTGSVFPRDVMAAILEHANNAGLYVISDEVYEDIVFEGAHVSAGSFGMQDRVFVVSGVSKSYAMTGWRLGWVLCPPPLALVAAGLQEPVTSCASTVAQKAAEAALGGDQACVSSFRDTFRRRRDAVVAEFAGSGLLPAVPAGAFYALVDIAPTRMASLDFCKALLLERGVATVPGITFGPLCDRYVRIAFTTGDANLAQGLARLKAEITKRR